MANVTNPSVSLTSPLSLDPVPTPSVSRNLIDISQIPTAKRHIIRIYEKVSEPDFIQAAKVTELLSPFPEIPHRAVGNALEYLGYPQRLIEITAPLRSTLGQLQGEYMIDDNKILSYKKVQASDLAGLLDLPEDMKGMDLVLRTQSLMVSGEDGDDEIIEMVAIKRAEPKVIQDPQSTSQDGWVTIAPSQPASSGQPTTDTQNAQSQWANMLQNTKR